MRLTRLLFAITIVLTFTGLASAQAPKVGTYEMEWAILHTPVSSDQPDLQNGTTVIQLEAVKAGDCPPTSAYVIKNAPASSVYGGTTTWCIKADGTFDFSAGTMSSGGLFQYTSDVFSVDGMNYRGNDRVVAVGRRQTSPPPPPPPPRNVSMTAPHNGDTVSGTNWVVLWVDGTGSDSKVFSLSVDGKAVGTPQTTSSNGPVSIPWPTTSVANGTHTLTGSVSGASGSAGSVSISIIVKN
jgi:hypothetical protein